MRPERQDTDRKIDREQRQRGRERVRGESERETDKRRVTNKTKESSSKLSTRPGEPPGQVGLGKED